MKERRMMRVTKKTRRISHAVDSSVFVGTSVGYPCFNVMGILKERKSL